MASLYKRKLSFSLFVLLLATQLCFGEIIKNEDFNFTLDIPEGYNLLDSSNDGLSNMYNHENIPVEFISIVYEDEGYFSSKDTLESALLKLSATADIDSFTWSNKECALAYVDFYTDQEYTGWALSAPVANNSYLVLICYSPINTESSCQKFIFSTLNSLSIDEYYYNTPGIITTYAFPKQGKKNFTTTINKQKITYSLDKSDIDAANFVIDMEYEILLYYANHELVFDAWKRYYRMIYRDNYGRIQNFAEQVYKTLYPIAYDNKPKNPDIEYAQYLLSWVQSFPYGRNAGAGNSDFPSIPAILTGQNSDCDSRSMLLCILLEYSGIDTLLLIAPEYSHALAAADINAPGQKIYNKDNDRDYIIGETTAPVTWGMLSQEQADRTKWFYVILP